MRRKLRTVGLTVLTTVAALLPAVAAEKTPLWTPIADTVYEQEVGATISTKKPVWALALFQDILYAGFGDGVRALNAEGKFADVAGAPTAYVERLRVVDGRLWVFTQEGLHVFDGTAWAAVSSGKFADITTFAGEIVVATPGSLHRVQGNALVNWPGGGRSR